MKTHCTKPQAGVRQIDVAITLMFADYDPLAIRTLAGAAHGIFADLVEANAPGNSWRTKIIEGSGLSKNAAISLLNSTQNYLKHADRDPGADLEFDEEENDHLMFIVTLECGQLGHPLTIDMQIFQIWYLAMYPEKIGSETEVVRKSRQIFSDFDGLDRQAKLARGAQFAARMKELEAQRLTGETDRGSQ